MPRMQRDKPEKGKAALPLDIGQAVRRLREEKGLSGAELCRRGKGIDPKTLVALEKGRIRNPSIVTLEALAKGFGMTVSFLAIGALNIAADEKIKFLIAATQLHISFERH